MYLAPKGLHAPSSASVRTAIAVAITAVIALFFATGSASAAIGVSSYSLTPSTTTHAANPDLSINATRSGSSSDDLKQATLSLPAGMNYSLAAATKCSSWAFSIDSCPASSIVGTATLSGNLSLVGWRLSSGSASGTAYALSNSQFGTIYRPSGLANISVKTNVGGSSGAGISLTSGNYPRTTYLFGFIPLDFTISGASFSLYGKSNSTKTGPVVVTNPDACGTASSTLTFNAYNGSSGSKSSAFNVTGCAPTDTAPPVISNIDPASGSSTTDASITLMYSAVDDSGVAPTCTPASGSTIPLALGENSVTITCTDGSGNSSSATALYTRTTPPDVTAPSISNIQPPFGSVINAPSFTLTYDATDDSGVAPTCTPASGSMIPLPAGVTSVSITCVDGAGNATTVSGSYARADTQAPVVNITSPVDGSTTTDASTQLAFVAVDESGGPVTCDKSNGDIIPLSLGTNTITVTCSDLAGNSGSDTVIVIRAPLTPVLTVTQFAPPSTNTTGSPRAVTFSATNNPTGYECRSAAATTTDPNEAIGSSWVPCSSPWDVAIPGGTADGTNVIYEIKAVSSGSDSNIVRGFTWKDDRAYTAVPTVAPHGNSLVSEANAANAGAHPNISATLEVQGYDDAKSATVTFPDGLVGSLSAIPQADRCTLDEAQAGNCPASALIGTGSGHATSPTDGTITISSAQAKLYLVDANPAGSTAIPSQYAAGVALQIKNINGAITGNMGDVNAQGYLALVDGARNMKLQIDDIPNQTTTGKKFHVQDAAMTINGDTGGASAPLITNPHFCGPFNTNRVSPGGKTANYFYGTATSYQGNTTPELSAQYSVVNCGPVPFNPSMSMSLSNPVAGASTALTTTLSLPDDNSTVRLIQVKLPPFVAPDFTSFGTPSDQCSSGAVSGSNGSYYQSAPANGGSVAGYREFTPVNCPPQARIGQATISSPLLPGTVTADVYLINYSPIPWLGIYVDPTKYGNPQGVRFGLIGNTGTAQVDANCDPLFDGFCPTQISAMFSSIPDVPLSSMELTVGGVTGRGALGPNALLIASHSDPVCVNSGETWSALIGDWSHTTFTALNGPLEITGCDNGDVNPPTISNINPPDGFTTPGSSVVLTYTATDDVSTPSCSPASGSTIALAPGANPVTITCSDGGGNSTSATVTYTSTVAPDTTDPVVSITAPVDGSTTTDTSTTLSFTATDDSGAAPTCDATDGASISLSLGANVITVTCTDGSGNSGSDTVTVTRVTPPDTTPPVISAVSPVDGFSTTDTAVTVTFTATDDSGVAPSCTPTSGSTVNLAIGTNPVTITCTDGAGNNGVATVTYTRVDVPPPPPVLTASQLAPPSTKTTGSSRAVTFSASNGPSTYECRSAAATSSDPNEAISSGWGACSSPWDVTIPAGTADGTNVIYEIKATNAGGDSNIVRGFTWKDDRAFTAIPTVAPHGNSLVSEANAANAGAHPDVSASLEVQGYDDAQSVTIQFPDGLMGSLAAIPKTDRCTLDEAQAGNCPASALVGVGSGHATSETDGTIEIDNSQAKLYLVDATPTTGTAIPSQYAAAVALQVKNINGGITGPQGDVNAQGYLRINDGARNIKLQIDDIPTETTTGKKFHIQDVALTVNGDTGGASAPLITNPHFCGPFNTARVSPGGKTANYFWGTGTSYQGNTTPEVSAQYSVTNCAAVPYNPTMSISLDNPVAGESTALSTTISVPAESSTLRLIQVKLPPFVAPDFTAFGPANAQCSAGVYSGGSTGSYAVSASAYSSSNYFQFSKANCPTSAIMGQAILNSPLLPDPVTADVYLINASPIPYIGVYVDPTKYGNPQGVEFGLLGTTSTPQVNPTCDPLFDGFCPTQIVALFSSTPDVPLSSMELTLGGVTGRALGPNALLIAAPSDPTCVNAGGNWSALIGNWSNTTFANRSGLLTLSGCNS